MVTRADELEYLTAQAGLRARIEGQMTALFADVVGLGESPEQIRDALIALARSLVSQYGQAAATFAAGWYDDMRDTQGIPGAFTATEYVQDFDERVERTVRRAVGGLFGDSPNPGAVVDAIATKAAQYALDGARNTIVQNAYRDPRSGGWARVPHGKTCDFCLLLVGRGGVYRTERAASFKAHRNCDCGAVPSWDPEAKEVPSVAYRASERMQALRDRAKKGDRGAQWRLSANRKGIASYIEDNQDEFARLRKAYDLEPAI